MRKWTWAATAMLVAVPLAWFWLAPRSAINEANFAKLREGMTRAEVEAILGGPPRDESTGELALVRSDWHDNLESEPVGRRKRMLRYIRFLRGNENGEGNSWINDHVVIDCCFAESGLLSRSKIMSVERADGFSPVAVFRRLLRR